MVTETRNRSWIEGDARPRTVPSIRFSANRRSTAARRRPHARRVLAACPASLPRPGRRRTGRRTLPCHPGALVTSGSTGNARRRARSASGGGDAARRSRRSKARSRRRRACAPRRASDRFYLHDVLQEVALQRMRGEVQRAQGVARTRAAAELGRLADGLRRSARSSSDTQTPSSRATLRGGGSAELAKPVSRNAAGAARGRIYGWRRRARVADAERNAEERAAAHGDARAHHLEAARE